MHSPPVRTTRLAPSPTGALHMGNARTFLINWALARQQGWRIVLRIEDLDGPRLKPGADRGAIEDLRWLGLDWDEGPVYQSDNLAPYQQALDALSRRSLTYPCTCSRSQIRSAASAPHGDKHELRYPNTCRPRNGPHPPQDDTAAALRLIVPDGTLPYHDQLHGPQSVDVQEQVGDYVVRTKAGLPAYQLAVVVDDARQQITDVVRGDDLLRSTARQLWLYKLLELRPLPRYWHVPLVAGPDGRRLAKRHGDTRLSKYRSSGVPPQRVIGLLAHTCGLVDQPEPMEASEFKRRFNLAPLPRSPVTFTTEAQAWLGGR